MRLLTLVNNGQERGLDHKSYIIDHLECAGTWWAGLNSSLQSDDQGKPKAKIGILPLFPQNAATVAMVKHSLFLGKSLTDYLYPDQTSVKCKNHQIYVIVKQI